MQVIMEVLFDIVYLSTVVILGFTIFLRANGRRQYQLFGIMAIVLGFGDAFHLVPRAVALLTTGFEANIYYLGIGKLVTSITMTIFYLILYYAYRIRYDVKGEKNIMITFYVMAIARIVLTLLPQNEWTSLNPPLSFAIYRNIPFTVMGVMIIVLFYKASRKYNDKAFKNMWLSIVLSFAFYLPVVLFSGVYPLVGMLMIPKTMAYVWTVVIAYKDMKNNSEEVPKDSFRGLINAAFIYILLALSSGVFYREFTKYVGYNGYTKLSLLHVHMMVLGTFLYFLLAAFALNTNLLNVKKFKIFRKLYIFALPFMMVVVFTQGVIQAMQVELSSGANGAINGMSGLSHIVLSVAFVYLFLSFRDMKMIKK